MPSGRSGSVMARGLRVRVACSAPVRRFVAKPAQICGKRVLFGHRLPDRLCGMPDYRPLRGRLSRLERPDWDPLIDLVGLDLVRWFMWMGQIELVDDTRVHAYKHV